ncbi:hypothetical protein BCEN4_590026 [Burkholderia cenocepacia]|nr:hypothetical protein BCEN4_590026 [Burkholderia cenocepacia]
MIGFSAGFVLRMVVSVSGMGVSVRRGMSGTPENTPKYP